MRGKQAPKRHIKADEVYNSELVTKFINYVMISGNKSAARKHVYFAIEKLATETKKSPVEALSEAIENIRPKVEVKSKRVGGANYQVPVQVPEGRQNALAFKWIIESARKGRGAASFSVSLSREIINAYKKEGSAIKKKEEVRRMAEANKAFAQFS
jgi:small subunit ribosomal protein S7